MRLFTLIASVLALAFWGGYLFLGIEYLNFSACIPETSISGELLLQRVALPAVMMSLSFVSLILISFRQAASKFVLALALVNLASMPVYWASYTSLIVDEPTLSICADS